MEQNHNMLRGISENGGIVFYGVDSTEIVREMERLHKTSAVTTAALGRLLTEASKRCRPFCIQLVFRLEPAVVYSFVPSPPKARLILSTYSINSRADFFPIYSYKVPPKSLVILYFPSENAPAPPKPLMIEQFLQ